jgi:uroporphyrinogen decarboxylase
MKHRDRVQIALDREAPDRCPMQISFTPEFADRLRAEMGIEPQEGGEHNPHGGGNTYALETTLDQDVLITSVGWANSYYSEEGFYTDEWGVGWSSVEYETPFGKGRYTEVSGHPLADEAAITRYEPPDPNRPGLYIEPLHAIEAFKEEYWIAGATVTTIFECAWALRGLERLMMDFIEDPDLADAILEIPYRYHKTAALKLVELGVDMIWTGDDFGMQSGMMISPDTWRRFFKTRMAEFFAACKAVNPDLKIAYHSDGDIRAIIPDLIEIGMDVLNPVQPACMDPEALKKMYGDRICFWGSIDEQHTLPFAKPEDVAREVRTRLETIGAGGGLIIGPTHHVQLDTPMENFKAMVDAIRSPIH